MQGTMCGIVKESAGPGLVYRTDLPIPQIDDDELLIKVHCTAVCGSDLHMNDWDEWSRKRMKPPVIVGHETAGDVIEVGKDVTNIKAGDRVSVETHIPCDDCYFCKNDLKEICSNVELFGVSVDGAFAEYTKVKAKNAYKIEDGISYEMACMFEPMGAAVHGVEAGHVEGKSVLICGLGALGMTAVTSAKVLGATTVIATARSDKKLEIAKQMGADYVVNYTTEDLVAEIKKLTGGLGVDVVIEVTGYENSILNGLKCVRAAGRVVIVGLPTKPTTLNLTEDIIYRQVELTGISGRRIWGTWDNFAKVMQDPRYKLEYVMGEKYALRDYEKAFERLRSGAPGKNLIYP